MFETGFNLVLIILGFGVLIFVHETGHFLAAKWAGIRTEVFAIGIGKHFIGVVPQHCLQVLLGHIRAFKWITAYQHFMEIALGQLQHGKQFGCFCGTQPRLIFQGIAACLQQTAQASEGMQQAFSQLNDRKLCRTGSQQNSQ